MLIYNITFHITLTYEDIWLNWAKTELIPFLISHENVSEPQIARILSADDKDGKSYSVQFKTPNMQVLENWHKNNSNSLQQLCAKRFGNNVLFFGTALEILE